LCIPMLRHMCLKMFYPNSIYFASLAHGLQRVSEEPRAKFPQENKLISITEKLYLKASHPV
jgi:hypothetical protein